MIRFYFYDYRTEFTSDRAYTMEGQSIRGIILTVKTRLTAGKGKAFG
jgi:hypothetical protein